MRNSIILMALLFSGLLPLHAQSEEVPKITVTGEGVVNVAPDQAFLYFGIRTEGEDAIAVKSENDALVSRLLEVLSGIGVKKKDIRTQRMDLQKSYDHREKKENYQAVQNFVLHIRDLKGFETINTTLLTSGVNRMERIVFEHSDRKTFEEKAREAAVTDAMNKVALYSEALGRTTGDLIVLEEVGGFDPVPVYRVTMAENDAGSAPAIAPGELRIACRIRVVWGLK